MFESITKIGLNLIYSLSWFIVVDHNFIHYINGYFQQVMVPRRSHPLKILGFSINLNQPAIGDSP